MFITTYKTFCLFYEVFKVHEVGGDEENRTPDPLLARQVLSQLSYAPSLYISTTLRWKKT